MGKHNLAIPASLIPRDCVDGERARCGRGSMCRRRTRSTIARVPDDQAPKPEAAAEEAHISEGRLTSSWERTPRIRYSGARQGRLWNSGTKGTWRDCAPHSPPEVFVSILNNRTHSTDNQTILQKTVRKLHIKLSSVDRRKWSQLTHAHLLPGDMLRWEVFQDDLSGR